MKYNTSSADSIIRFAKQLEGKTLKEVNPQVEQDFKIGNKGKGNLGQLIEEYYFGYKPNSISEPDFPKAGLELKCSPLKQLKNGEYRAKERLVLNIINYLKIHKEKFNSSSFWKKNAHLLLIFYIHEKGVPNIDLLLKLIDDWEYPKEDLEIIKQDWHIIVNKIREGKAHELSEGDTYYLGACTKGSTAKKSFRRQPFSVLKAKQRAFSLKTGYVNHIIASISKDEENIYGKLKIGNVKDTANKTVVKITNKEDILIKKKSIGDIVIEKFKPFYGKTTDEIYAILNLKFSKNSKGYFAQLSNAIIGLEKNDEIEEFKKANITLRTLRIKPSGMPKEHVSFPTFKFENLFKVDWEDSELKNILESKFFFVFYKLEGDVTRLEKAILWNMPYDDIQNAHETWKDTVKIIKSGMIIKENIGNRTLNYFPKASKTKVIHVRPHAQDKNDTYMLPISDKLTGKKSFTKQSFWLNSKYIRDRIYLNIK